MADETTKPKSNMLLYLALAGAGAYLVLSNSTSTAKAADSWLNTPLTDTSTGAASTPTAGAPGTAAVTAPTTAPAMADAGGNIYSDGAPHRHAGNDLALTSWNDTDRGNIQKIVNYWNSNGGRITVEDAVDIVTYQESQDRKGWNTVARDYADNPTWFQDKVREWNNEGRMPRIQIPT